MRTKIALFTLISCMIALTGCADLKLLVKDGLLGAAKGSVEDSKLNAGARVTVDQNNLAQIAKTVSVLLTGLPNDLNVRYVDPSSRYTYEAVPYGGGNFTINVADSSRFWVGMYKPDGHGGELLVYEKVLNSTRDYVWNEKKKKLEEKK